MERIERRYYKSGALMMECRIRNGLYDGDCKVFYESGQLKSIRKFSRGRIAGEHLEYYESGALMWRYPTSGGNYNGMAEEYFEDGGIKSQINYENGMAEGLLRHYDEDGSVAAEIPYRHGDPDGIARYYEDGRLYMQLPYEKGMRQGFSQYFDSDGDIFRTSIFIDNECVASKQIDYFGNGAISCECSMEGYLPDGEVIYYHANGKIASTITFSKGIAVDGRYDHFDYTGYKDGYTVFSNNMAKFYDKCGVLLKDWVNFRHRSNGPCRTYQRDGTFDLSYMSEGTECDSQDEFIEDNCESIADRCYERFGKRRLDLSTEAYKQFFCDEYRTATESLAAKTEYMNYSELAVCDIMTLDDSRYIDYMVRDFILRFRLPNDGETERRIARDLHAFVGIE